MRNITPEEELPIWQKEALFPEKPVHIPYGYIPYKGQAVGANSLADLKSAVKQETDSIYGVWRPERERIIPIAEAPELLDELKPKRIKESHDRLKSKRLIFILCAIGLCTFLYPAIRDLGKDFYKYPMVGMASIMAVIFGAQPFYQAWKSYQSALKLSAETLGEEAREMRFEIWMARQRAPFTKALTFALVGIFILQGLIDGNDLAMNDTVKAAGLRNKALLNGESWRLWTAAFLHGGIIHMFFNGSALWHLGKRVEVLAKWAHFLMVFISSALIGSLCSIQFLPMVKFGVGASGGIMGLLGFLLTFELMHPKLSPKPARRRLLAGIVMMFIIGFLGVAFIDNAAHAGGLLAGVAYAFIAFSKSSSAKRPELQPVDWVIGIGSLILIAWSLFLTYSKIA